MLILSFDVGIINLAYCVLDEHECIHKWGIINLASGNNKFTCMSEVKSGKRKGDRCGRKAHYGTTKADALCTIHGRAAIADGQAEVKRNVTVGNSTDQELKTRLFEELEAIKTEFSDAGGFAHILIEKQPGKAREKIKGIAHALFDYFVLRKLDEQLSFESIGFIDAKNKLKVYEGPPISCHLKTQYARNKWYAQRYCEYMLAEDACNLEFMMKHKKKDDLADCYLQGIWYLKFGMTGKEAPISSAHQKLVYRDNNLVKYEKVRARKAHAKQLVKNRWTLANLKYIAKTKATALRGEAMRDSICFYFGEPDEELYEKLSFIAQSPK